MPATSPRPRTGRLKRWAMAVVPTLVLVPAVVVTGAAPAQADAGTGRDFSLEYAKNVNGDIVFVANTLMTCTADGPATCAQIQSGARTGPNNDYQMGFVDIDGNASTFNSSSATLTVPTGATVLHALLVWGGRLTTGNAGIASAKNAWFKPGSAPYSTVTGSIDWYADTNGEAYQASTDVTAAVAALGVGTHTITVGNVQSETGGNNRYAGWSLVVALADPAKPSRNLSIFTGLKSVKSGTGTDRVDIPVSGFLTPQAGAVRTTIGAITYEGDDAESGTTYIGDQLLISRASPVSYVNLGDATSTDPAYSPTNNVFNSTISTRSVTNPGRTPSYANQLGFDADLISADGLLGNSDTSALLRFTTSGEQFYPGVLTFATDLYDPKLNGAKTVTDLNGGLYVRSDVLRYTVPVRNDGLDDAKESLFFDAIPTGTTYVPGTITLDSLPMTDGVDADPARFVPGTGDTKGHVEVDLGIIPVTPQAAPAPHTVTFDVRIDDDVANGQPMINSASLAYRGLNTNASSASVTNTVSSVVDSAAGGAPVAYPDVLSFEPTVAAPSVTVPVLANDTGAPPLTVIGVTDAAGGTVVINPDGTITYTPRTTFAGRDVFTYTIADVARNAYTTTVQIDVVNSAPVAGDDSRTVARDASTVVSVLGNDTDADGDPLTVVAVPTGPAHGTVSLVAGVLTYTPTAGYTGADSFTYTVEDPRGGRDTATVSLTVTNTAPVAQADSYRTNQGVAVAVSVLDNDSDPNGDTLSATKTGGPSHGTLTLAADGTGTYTPTAGWHGTDTVSYQVSDGHGGTATASVTIVVNAPPVAADDSASTPTNTPVTITVRSNDSDPEGDAITVTAVTPPVFGAAVLNADGTITYTPADGFFGTEAFGYTLSDGSLTTTATVRVTVSNAAPVAHGDSAATTLDAPVTVDVLANDTDPNIPATSQVLSVASAVASNGATVVVNADGTLTVTPATGFRGVVTVTYTVSDGAYGTPGTAVGTLTVTVANGVPSAVADTASTPTDTPVLVDVLANDSDPNGDPVAIVSVTPPLAVGGAPAGTAVVESGQVRYTPPPGFAGVVTFGYVITDGEGGIASAVATVTVGNAAPVAADDAATTDHATPVTVDVLGNDTDANIPGTAQALTVTAASADHGATVVLEPDGRLTVTPAAGYAGTVTVTYTVGDGAGGSDTGTLVVTVRNAAPVAVGDAVSTPFGTPVTFRPAANDTDPNGDPLALVDGSLTAPFDAGGTPRGTLTVVDGVVTYTPPAGFSGPVTFSYQVSDGHGGTSTATVTLTVGNAPPAAGDDTATTTPGRPVTIDVIGNDGDPDGGTLTVVAVSQPARGGVVAIVDGAVVFTPATGFTGTVTFTYTVSDGNGGLATGTVTVVVPGAGGGSLAATGAEVAGLAGLALALVLAGLGLAWAARRRRAQVLAD